ncbi:hypothetical protein [Aurantimonas endophytica]|uniref:Uncharacterized protein n=1 Tax=Aurantimonas endophytica TaxID=1522175 RepID=A0A7W6HG20_9HYPH|nr:hypothetical protein [Aurantimonas endophytica]MBB4004462.1 hypothetical protein [Aurantimonas endophytica]MCO6405298.1 hypothetical protein [Aurantimonas endophytica]
MSAPSPEARPPAIRFDDQCCGVCARQASGFGYAPKQRYGQPAPPIMWVCESDDCIRIARDSYSMTEPVFNRIEALAVAEGLDRGRDFAISISTADLAEMTDAQRLDFARAIVAGYRDALKVKLREEAPF